MIEKGGFIFTNNPPDQFGDWRILTGDALTLLSKWKDPMADCWVTSPPYFNQFNYSVEGQIGLEASVADYISVLRRIASEMRRISKPKANLFWVIRDSNNGSGGPGGDYPDYYGAMKPKKQKDVPRKAQLLIPERTRIAFSYEGWVPIMSVVWDKKDSRHGARDKPSYSYEHILLFAAEPDHYWDREAVLQPYSKLSLPQMAISYAGHGMIDYGSLGLEDPSDVKRNIIKSMQRKPGAYLRAVWHVPPGRQPRINVDGQELKAFSAFPLLLAEICINLGCPPGGLVMDPFCGFGTTMIAASQWGRDSIGIELSPIYVKAAVKRIREEGL